MHKSIVHALHERLRHFAPDLADLPEAVWKRAGALNTWGTNAIEGNTLTHEQVDALLLRDEVAARLPRADVMETIQHEQAFRSLLERRGKPVTLVTALELHELVFRGMVAKRPGQWRTSNVFIAGTTYRPPRREQVIAAMDAWEAELRKIQDPFVSAAWMHHRFEQIHPFEDGNGRAGRLLLNLHFMNHGWPPVHIMPSDRAAYLDALEAGNRGDLAPLEALLRTCMARGILDLLDQVGDGSDELVPLSRHARRTPHKTDYLALRCRQGVIPALRADETSGPIPPNRGRPRWLTSEAALRICGLLGKRRRQ
jgi:Fic family protein